MFPQTVKAILGQPKHANVLGKVVWGPLCWAVRAKQLLLGAVLEALGLTSLSKGVHSMCSLSVHGWSEAHTYRCLDSAHQSPAIAVSV